MEHVVLHKRRITVMHVLNTGAYSGAENVVITLINSLKNEYDCVYVSLDGSIRRVLEQNKIKFFPIPKLTVRNLKKAIMELRPDIIHAHDFTAGVIASASTFKIPIISHLHNNAPWIRNFSAKTIVYAISAIKFKKILTVSSSVMDEYIFGGGFRHKNQVVGNPVDVQAIIKKAENAEITDAYDVIFLGRITQPKNPLFFVEVIGVLIGRIPNLRVAMIGDGELREEVEQRIEQLSIQENVVMYGFLENPLGILKNSKVMCMPSLWEGFGLSAVEALALGIPVVSAPVGGLINIVNESCGFLCNSKSQYVESMYSILSDNKIREKKSKQARERALQIDNVTDYSKIIMGIYKDIFYG